MKPIYLVFGLIAFLLLSKKGTTSFATGSGIPNQTLPGGSSSAGNGQTIYGGGTNPVVNILTNSNFDSFLGNLTNKIFD